MTYHKNPMGMRDQEYPSSVYAKMSTHKKILVLGDSFTTGVGLPQGEEYHSIVEHRHAEIIFLNAAHTGLGIEEEEIVFRHFLEKTNAQLVLIGTLANDLIDLKAGRGQQSSASTRARRWGIHRLTLAIAPYMPQRLVLLLRGALSKEWTRIYQVVLDEAQQRRYDQFVAVMRTVQAFLFQQDPPIPLVVLLIPQVEQVNGLFDGKEGLSARAPFDHLKRRLAGSGIAVLDGLPHFLERENPSSLFFPTDRHLTLKGQIVLADFLDQHIDTVKPLISRSRQSPGASGEQM